MKVAVFSMKKFNNEHIEWHRDGYGYSYYKNELRKVRFRVNVEQLNIIKI